MLVSRPLFAFALSLSLPIVSRGFVISRAGQFTHRLFARLFSQASKSMESRDIVLDGEEWLDVLPMEKSSHNSARIKIPRVIDNPLIQKSQFQTSLASTIQACRELGKSSLWVEVPMEQASLIQDMTELGIRFHHAFDETAVLNIWLRDGESKIPEFATHNVGVGAVVVNSRDEILLVRELRKNYMPWKTPTGLSELGEQLDEAAEREVLEETGIETTFHSVLGFRQTHGMANGRSDLFFVCRLDPKEQTDESGQAIIPEPVPQENEIEKAAWVPLDEYRAMINDKKTGGHPTMRHIIDVLDEGRKIEKMVVQSVVPGRKPNSIYFPKA